MMITPANAGPEPLAAQDEALAAGDMKRAEEVAGDIGSVPRHTPEGQRELFRS